SRNAEMAMGKVFQENLLYTRDHEKPIAIPLNLEERARLLKLAKIAALLHDIGHGPLSHALDSHLALHSENPDRKADQTNSIKYVSQYLEPVILAAGINPKDVTSLFSADRTDLAPWMHFIADLIDSPLDVDRMDYLARDAHMTGLSAGALNMQALLERI